MKKVFVTGGTGFIGSHFVNLAATSGFEVVSLRRSNSSRPRIEVDSRVNWVSVGMDELQREHFRDVDVLVHLAAHSANPPYASLEDCLKWNVDVPLQMIRTAHSAGINRFVIAGSCFEYGASGTKFEQIPVDAPLEPVGTYATSKAIASLAFRCLAEELSLQLSIHRLFQVFGEGELDARLWPSLRKAALSGESFPMTLGEQVRDFICVSDVVAILLKYCNIFPAEAKSVWITNVGTGYPQTVLEFSKFWWNHWKARGQLLVGAIPYRSNEVMRFVPLVDSLHCPRT
jgi:nucleoside-diphosphate-sugar epimerase